MGFLNHDSFQIEYRDTFRIEPVLICSLIISEVLQCRSFFFEKKLCGRRHNAPVMTFAVDEGIIVSGDRSGVVKASDYDFALSSVFAALAKLDADSLAGCATCRTRLPSSPFLPSWLHILIGFFAASSSTTSRETR